MKMNWRPAIMFVLAVAVLMSVGWFLSTNPLSSASDAEVTVARPLSVSAFAPSASAQDEFTIAGWATLNLTSDIQIDTAEPIANDRLMIVLSANDTVEPGMRYLLSVRDQDGNPLAADPIVWWDVVSIPGGLVTVKLDIPNLTSQYDQLFIALRKCSTCPQ